jgi:hypothetical protein
MREPEERVQIDRSEGEGGAYSAAKRIPKLAAVVSLAQICAGGNQSALRVQNLVTMDGDANITYMACERKVCSICP